MMKAHSRRGCTLACAGPGLDAQACNRCMTCLVGIRTNTRAIEIARPWCAAQPAFKSERYQSIPHRRCLRSSSVSPVLRVRFMAADCSPLLPPPSPLASPGDAPSAVTARAQHFTVSMCCLARCPVCMRTAFTEPESHCAATQGGASAALLRGSAREGSPIPRRRGAISEAGSA